MLAGAGAAGAVVPGVAAGVAACAHDDVVPGDGVDEAQFAVAAAATSIGDYDILKLLGSGGYGAVYDVRRGVVCGPLWVYCRRRVAYGLLCVYCRGGVPYGLLWGFCRRGVM